MRSATRTELRLGDNSEASIKIERPLDAIVAAMSSLAGIDLAALGAACEKYGVAELAVFGSVVTGEARPDSDIDVLYVLRDGVHLGRPVDLISKGALHARLRDAVLAQAQVVYAA